MDFFTNDSESANLTNWMTVDNVLKNEFLNPNEHRGLNISLR